MSNDENLIIFHFYNAHLRRDVYHGLCTTSDDLSESSSQSYQTQTQEGREIYVNDNDDYASSSSDVDFSQNKADYWENEDLSPNKLNTSTKDLSFSEIKDIFDDFFLSKHEKCPLFCVAIFEKCVSTKSRGSSTATTNAEVTLIQTNTCEVIKHAQLTLFRVFGHKKEW